MKRLLVLTGGGDCPGLNAVIRAIVKRAAQEKDWEVLGSIQAYNGILWEPTEVVRLTPESVRGIHFRGGTIIETTNKGGPFNWPIKNADGTWTTVDRSDEMLRKLQYMGIDAVIGLYATQHFPIFFLGGSLDDGANDGIQTWTVAATG